MSLPSCLPISQTLRQACGLLGLAALLSSGCATSPDPETAFALPQPSIAAEASSVAPKTLAADPPSAPAPVLDATTADEAYGLALAAWSHGNLHGAESTIEQAVHQFPGDQRLLLFQAACLRSGNQMDAAYQTFYQIYEIDPTTPEGRCALSMIYLDTHKQEDNVHFVALRNLVIREHPDDILLRWMLATQCANYSVDFDDADPRTRLTLAQEGANHFRRIFEQVESAPMPLRQTMGDVLSYLEIHEEARRLRDMALHQDGDL